MIAIGLVLYEKADLDLIDFRSMNRRTKHVRKRHRPRDGKTLFYAGVKSDGSPRGWSFIDLAISALCAVAALAGIVLILNWLWDTGVHFGK